MSKGKDLRDPGNLSGWGKFARNPGNRSERGKFTGIWKLAGTGNFVGTGTFARPGKNGRIDPRHPERSSRGFPECSSQGTRSARLPQKLRAAHSGVLMSIHKHYKHSWTFRTFQKSHTRQENSPIFPGVPLLRLVRGLKSRPAFSACNSFRQFCAGFADLKLRLIISSSRLRD